VRAGARAVVRAVVRAAPRSHRPSFPARPLARAPDHESLNSGEDYSEFEKRLGDAQNELAAACGSNNNRWLAWRTGPVMHVSVDADAWIYPPVWHLAAPQYAWLQAFLPTVNRTETPWLVFYSHRALYCTKTTDGECNSEAETLRYGFLGLEYGLEALLHEYGVDFAFAGHTHHFEATWPVYKNASTAHSYDAPSATIYVQSGIAGTGPGGDPFDVPQMEWESYRDTTFAASYSHLTFLDDATAHFEQRRAADGSVIYAFDVTRARHAFA